MTQSIIHKKIIVLVLLFLNFFTIVLATSVPPFIPILSYEGDVVIEKLDGTLDIDDNLNVDIFYTLKNQGEQLEKFSFSNQNIPDNYQVFVDDIQVELDSLNNLELKANEKVVINFKYKENDFDFANGYINFQSNIYIDDRRYENNYEQLNLVVNFDKKINVISYSTFNYVLKVLDDKTSLFFLENNLNFNSLKLNYVYMKDSSFVYYFSPSSQEMLTFEDAIKQGKEIEFDYNFGLENFPSNDDLVEQEQNDINDTEDNIQKDTIDSNDNIENNNNSTDLNTQTNLDNNNNDIDNNKEQEEKNSSFLKLVLYTLGIVVLIFLGIFFYKKYKNQDLSSVRNKDFDLQLENYVKEGINLNLSDKDIIKNLSNMDYNIEEIKDLLKIYRNKK